MIKRKEFLYGSQVRALCIRNDFYTQGTNSEYMHLLRDLCGGSDGMGLENPTNEQLWDIAQDIYDHSSVKRYGMDREETILNIMYMLANECMSIGFEIV